MSIRLGVDTGGTFTDLVAHNDASGEICVLKVPSTPHDPGEAIVAGIVAGQQRGLWRLSEIRAIVHGTTVATNALLQRRGAKTALITTRGFRDVLAIGRQNRPALYDLRSRRPEELVPRAMRFEVTERVLPSGEIEQPLDVSEFDSIIESLLIRQAEAVVVGLLHSVANPVHELCIAKILRERLPNVAVCLSHQIAAVTGEYERFSTAAANGFVQPVVADYLERLIKRLRETGVEAPVFVMKSSGGAASVEAIAGRCVETAVSGPAGGVRASVELSRHAPGRNVIAADMGGTSFDVAVVTDGEPQIAHEASIGGLPLCVPMLDIHTIGAGGGSVAWVDAGGALRVGPHSAGAVPGPACYGRGGDKPTVTDANLVLGRLAVASKLGGGMQLDRGAATQAIQDDIAVPLGLSVEAAALGILRIANVSMVAALKRLTIERGIDPREYTLCGFGGAGPLHAAELAEELGVTRVAVPPTPGVFSAIGLLMSKLREDRYTALRTALNADAVERIGNLAKQMVGEATSEIQRGDTAKRVRVAKHTVALRYAGQSNSLDISWPDGPTVPAEQLTAGFHRTHRMRFGFDRLEQPIEVAGVAISVEAIDITSHQDYQLHEVDEAEDDRMREVWFEDQAFPTPVVDRRCLTATKPILGPLVVEQADTTTIVPPGWRVSAGDHGTLWLRRVSPAEATR